MMLLMKKTERWMKLFFLPALQLFNTNTYSFSSHHNSISVLALCMTDLDSYIYD